MRRLNQIGAVSLSSHLPRWRRPRADLGCGPSALSLLCSVNDAVNVLPCATCAYLKGWPSKLRCLSRTTLAVRPPQTTDLAVWPWRCWPVPHLALPFPAERTSGSGPLRCRLSNRPLPPCPRAPAAAARVSTVPAPATGRGCPQAASAVATLDRRCLPAAPTWPATQRCPRNRAPRPCPPCVPGVRQVLAGRPPSGADTATAPEQGGRQGGRRRPTIHARPAGDGSGHQPPTDGLHSSTTSTRTAVQTGVSAARRAAAARWTLRPPGDGVRTAGVQCGHRRPPAGVRGYRKRSPGSWPLEGCRHRREARASWRCSGSPSGPRT